jgi:hypothetical protein
MNRTLIAAIAACITLANCKPAKEPPSAPKLDPATEAIAYARKIVSDPSNWKSNTALITDLGAAAQDLGVAESSEFKEFDLAAQDLIRFGTTWITSLDEGATTHLRNELSLITSKSEASVKTQINVGTESVPSGGGLEATLDTKQDAQRIQKEAERAVFTSIEGLRAAQADEFGKSFARAQTAYRALRPILQSKVKS